MPSRAFLLFGQTHREDMRRKTVLVSMPSRAFLLFGPEAYGLPADNATPRFNALAGIFAFRTLGAGAGEPRPPRRGFNALAGIFAFRTLRRLHRYRMGHARFNALAGIFAFRTRRRWLIPRQGVQFQCPRGHFCFSDAMR